MRKALIETDCVVEVHDARIPLTGRNINFQHDITGNKPHILVLNKKDLVFNPGSDGKNHKETGKSMSEALIFASPNPQFDNRLFIKLFNT